MDLDKDYKDITEFDIRREAELLNAIIEICAVFQVTNVTHNEKEEWLSAEYTNSDNHTGYFRIAFDKTMSSVFKTRTLKILTDARELCKMLYE